MTFTLTKKDYRVISELTAQGWPLTSIARLLGLGLETLRKCTATDDSLAMSIQEGRDRQEQALVNALFQRAVNLKDKTGHVCAMFLLKSRFGYVDRGDGDTGNSRVHVQITLPGALTPEQYQNLEPPNARLLAKTGGRTLHGGEEREVKGD